jgi:hypothetical protein
LFEYLKQGFEEKIVPGLVNKVAKLLKKSRENDIEKSLKLIVGNKTEKLNSILE